jgi:hypothetical protein
MPLWDRRDPNVYAARFTKPKRKVKLLEAELRQNLAEEHALIKQIGACRAEARSLKRRLVTAHQLKLEREQRHLLHGIAESSEEEDIAADPEDPEDPQSSSSNDSVEDTDSSFSDHDGSDAPDDCPKPSKVAKLRYYFTPDDLKDDGRFPLGHRGHQKVSSDSSEKAKISSP